MYVMEEIRIRSQASWDSRLLPASRGASGARLARLLGGGRMKWLLISNYMIDIHFLISHVPAILDAEAVVIVHGERHNNTRSAHLTLPPLPHAVVFLACMRVPLRSCLDRHRGVQLTIFGSGSVYIGQVTLI